MADSVLTPITPPPKEVGKGGLLAGGLVIVLAIAVIVLGMRLHTASSTLGNAQSQRDQAKAESGRLQTQLDQAKAGSAQLQTQVDQAKKAAADLQSQRDQAAAKTAQLQSQLDQAKSGSAQVQSQLDQAKSEAAQARSQLDQAKAASSQLQSQLTDANSKVSDLQKQLSDSRDKMARLEALATTAKQLPITTAIKKAKKFFGGSDYVLSIGNTSQQPLRVTVAVGSSRSQDELIEAGSTASVDDLAAGESIEIRGAGYASQKLAVQ